MANDSPERKELDRVLNALALELPVSVYTDASRRIRELFDAALLAERRVQMQADAAIAQRHAFRDSTPDWTVVRYQTAEGIATAILAAIGVKEAPRDGE